MKLSEIVPIREVSGLQFGVEVEMEGTLRYRDVEYIGWKTVPDGSLRNGVEFVMLSPMSLEYTLRAVENLYAELKHNNSVLDPSFRCSTHVHMNVSDLTLPQIMSICYTYLMVEDILMDYCGPLRKGNRFCLSAQDAETLVGTLASINRLDKETYRRLPHYLSQDMLKYAALNIYTLRKYGTLEFRGMPGEENPNHIKLWLMALADIYQWGVSSTIENTSRLIEQEGADAFLRYLFNPLSAEALLTENSADQVAYARSIFCELEF